MKTQNYKMRAECQADLSRFLEKIPVQSLEAKAMSVNGTLMPDLLISFSSILTLSQIQGEMGSIEDSHVMAETLALADQYTGERVQADLTVKFEVGKTYWTRSIGDSEIIYKITIAKRTAKTVTTTEGKVLRPFVDQGVEQVKPHGSYSMCAIISANKELISHS